MTENQNREIFEEIKVRMGNDREVRAEDAKKASKWVIRALDAVLVMLIIGGAGYVLVGLLK